MAFQVMGVTAGRKDSNCEILLKEALLACREQGAEVRMINLKDYELLDCNGCTACTMGMSMWKNTGCSLADKDDKQKIMDVMLEQDAVIFSAPTYDLMPSSLFLKFMHRNLAYESAFLTKIRRHRARDRVARSSPWAAPPAPGSPWPWSACRPPPSPTASRLWTCTWPLRFPPPPKCFSTRRRLAPGPGRMGLAT